MPEHETLMAEARQARAAGRVDLAHATYARAALAARDAGAPIAVADALRHLSDLDREAGRPTPALAAAQEAVALYRARADAPRLSLANALRQTALALEALGRPALDAWREAGDLYAELGVEAGVTEAEHHLGVTRRPR
ncbi:hypothetical protein [uncultured Caulobacter sp.]|uniref:hypothetical protein n=1 Tax=uncultured Caulobacter sp. TaxID=158749 RepID=UPI0026209A58|nr:hypothetical protein [uncultured Caulobacter sp.]